MRHLLLSIVILFTAFFSFSQNTGVGVGTTNPHPSALLELKDSARGFLPPRMTYAQREAIANPAAGLMIYCTDCGIKGEWQGFDGQLWVKMNGEMASSPLPPPDTTITSVTIGTQIWSDKNLNVARYRNGDPIPQVSDYTQWANLTTGAWCWYNNDSATYAASYGRLYNWYAVNDPRGLAPYDWHIPTDAEWTTLTNFLGGDSIAGGAMKSQNIQSWTLPNTGATNSSGFTGLPGGFRSGIAAFYEVGNIGLWWSSSAFDPTNVWYIGLYYTYSGVLRGYENKTFGLSVRLVRD
jgi:uncharacterized protein (TIGR02145 family)